MRRGIAQPLLLLLTFVALVLGVFFLLNNKQKKPNLTQQALPAPNERTGWKTYSSEKLGFSFDYPGNLSLEENCSKEMSNNNNPCIYSPDYQAVTTKYEIGEGGIDTVIEYNIGILLEIDTSTKRNYDFDNLCSPGGPGSTSNCQEKTINGTKIAFVEFGLGPYPPSEIHAVILRADKLAQYIFFQFSKNNKIKDIELFEKILSTFKFTN